MKDYNKDNSGNIFFDDNETAEDLIITDMTDDELDAEYERLFGSAKMSDDQ